MSPQRTLEGRWVIYERATGQRLERWPIDARGMLASGDYTADTSQPELAAPVSPAPAAVDPVPHLTTANAQNVAASPVSTETTHVPLVVSPPDGVGAAQPVELPVSSAAASKGKRGR